MPSVCPVCRQTFAHLKRHLARKRPCSEPLLPLSSFTAHGASKKHDTEDEDEVDAPPLVRYGTGAYIDIGTPSRDHPLAPRGVNGDPFALIVVGRRGGGKSETVANLLGGSTLQHMVYDIGPRIRRGVKVDKELEAERVAQIDKRLVYPDRVVYCTTNPDESIVCSLRSMYEFLEEHDIDQATFEIVDIRNEEPPTLDELDPKARNLVVFDDCLAEGPGWLEKNVTPFFIRGRHKNASVILVTQSWYDLPAMIRRNATTVALVGSSGDHRHTVDVIRQLIGGSDDVVKDIERALSDGRLLCFDLQRAIDDHHRIRVDWTNPLSYWSKTPR